MSDLKNYVETLDNFDEKNSIISEFIQKLEAPIDYKEILDRFDWKPEYFAELDAFLINAGYVGRDDIIGLIKEFLTNKLKSVGIMKYNKSMKADVWNHYELLEQNLGKIEWRYLSANPSAIDLLNKYTSKISWQQLSANPAGMELLRKNPGKIQWEYLSENTNSEAIDLLEMNFEKISWLALSKNPAAIDLIMDNKKFTIYYDQLCCQNLSRNPAAIDLLEDYERHICWRELSSNPGAARLLKANQREIRWDVLSSNPGAVDIIKQTIYDYYHSEEEGHKLRINWRELSKNTNPEAIKILEQYPENIHWAALSKNPAGIKLIEQHLADCKARGVPDQINWEYLSMNSAAIKLIRSKPEKIGWGYLCQNTYTYEAEKFEHFNKSNYLQRSQLKLTM